MHIFFFDGTYEKKDYNKAKAYYMRTTDCDDDAYSLCRGEAYFKLSRFYDSYEKESGRNQFGEYIDFNKVKSYLESAAANGYDCRAEIAVVNQRLHIDDEKNEMEQFVRSLKEAPDGSHLYNLVEKNIAERLPKSWVYLGRNAKNCLITGFLQNV